MSKEAREWLKDQRIADATLKAVVRAIAWGADKGGGECRAKQGDLAAEASLSDRAVRTALVVLERLEIITRKSRSKGKFGRTTDLIVLALGRNFDVSRPTVQAIRKSIKPALQPERGSSKNETCNRNEVPLQPERGSRDSYPVDPVSPYQEEGNTEVEGYSSTSGDRLLPDGESYAGNVIMLTRRGAA